METATEEQGEQPVVLDWAGLLRFVSVGFLVTAAAVVALMALFVAVPYFFGSTVESCGGIFDPLTGEHICGWRPGFGVTGSWALVPVVDSRRRL